MAEKTIREFAEIIGYSKQRIQQVIGAFEGEQRPRKRGNRFVLSDRNQADILKVLGLSDRDIVREEQGGTESRLADEELVKELLEQLKGKDQQIEALQNLLKQQQQLLIQLNQRIYEAEEQASLSSGPAEQVPQEEDSLGNKKWWNFFKEES